MKAVVFKGPWDVSVEQVSDPKIEESKDAIIKITTANICGPDLHPYEGRAPLDAGMVLGHENMGVVAETGPGCDRSSVGPGLGAVQRGPRGGHRQELRRPHGRLDQGPAAPGRRPLSGRSKP
jgi:D-arabinose 1-dehydrogenase-like Zn-dependent alcohol dehydrogenase